MSIKDLPPIELATPPEREARLHVGARGDMVTFGISTVAMLLTPDTADAIATSLHRFAMEARHGGAVPGLTTPLPGDVLNSHEPSLDEERDPLDPNGEALLHSEPASR